MKFCRAAATVAHVNHAVEHLDVQARVHTQIAARGIVLRQLQRRAFRQVASRGIGAAAAVAGIGRTALLILLFQPCDHALLISGYLCPLVGGTYSTMNMVPRIPMVAVGVFKPKRSLLRLYRASR